MDICDEAARKLIEGLGGEKMARQLVGGTIWWQVRSTNGINAQWIVNNGEEVQQRKGLSLSRRLQQKAPVRDSEYDSDSNKLPCLLFFHGGGYFSGSVDQVRFAIEVMALMPAIRIFAVSYRLAPQYPFPCAIQDALASYLYLINPPFDVKHAVDPKQLIISGDSAGGGLALALFQIIRDNNLPKPAGGILISPWCDLTHSFPSTIHTNTKTDFIPKYGLSIYRPSFLWPPPSDEHARRASSTSHENRDSRRDPTSRSYLDSSSSPRRGEGEEATDRMPSAPIPRTAERIDKTLRAKTEDGGVLELKEQMHIYAPNNLLVHPLVSPALSYLGGLPPLFVFAGDGEVLRDEIIYTAHKAAYPKHYPVHPGAKKMYPKLEGIENRYEPTCIHLQVYDNAPHVFPILCFSCDASQACFRSIRTFIKKVIVPIEKGSTSDNQSSRREQGIEQTGSVSNNATGGNELSAQTTKANTYESSASSCGEPDQRALLACSGRLYNRPVEGETSPFMQDTMIRVRVSARGEVRHLEQQSELNACTMPPEDIGVANERVLRRYTEGNVKWRNRFSKTDKRIHKRREEKLEYAKILPSGKRRVKSRRKNADSASDTASTSHLEHISQSSNMNWAWAVKDDEHPPPSSIVARLDTKEACRIARIVDKPGMGPYRTKLWPRAVCEAKRNKERSESDKHQAESDDRQRRSSHVSENEPAQLVSYGPLILDRAMRMFRFSSSRFSKQRNPNQSSVTH
ncbi:alpha/beta-hydrolase [Fomitiporia mediterranea MF3/22]|uniref:alpha/beta-hydrolase n=1 Tax=Fomitiporia mediterranea (strain MF3/22) TaxID=694068 RepID=UPI0004409851|nr:alpha/beta-hydrolase [Fomitiporia mediterranea MF3/22]EJD08015.1 alpha/beta-hydrolase [Fomitiporia mediterranea MF3/22]